MKKIIFLFTIILLLSGCSKIPNNSCVENSGNVCSITGNVNVLDNSDIKVVSDQIMNALKNKDMELLSQFVSPAGVRFSPYNYVDIQQDVILKQSDLNSLWDSDQKSIWGTEDGSGRPIDITFQQYFFKYIYDVDFANAPQKLENKKVTRGNMVNNIWDVYAGKYFIEYYFSGFDPQYEGMDRRSLTLVFDKINNEWKLMGIVHAQRTT